MWLLGWERYRSGDFPGARSRFEALSALYRDIPRARRLGYWRARCLEAEGQTGKAAPVFAELAAAVPADLYARFARGRVARPARLEQVAVTDPSTTTAAFSRVDELLRLRMFEEASAESRRLLPSRGRDLRQAQSDFALGRFLAAASAIKRALPEIARPKRAGCPTRGAAYYPIEEGTSWRRRDRVSLDAAGSEASCGRRASSTPGQVARRRHGVDTLMPATAKSLARSVLRSRYRRAFLYDPG